MPRKPGDLVTKSVRLLRQLATGGMGSFWTAWHEALGVEVGVKFIDERYVEDPEALERFRREAAMAARIKSPHIVQVFDHGVMDDGAPYIIMELLEGESLGDRIDKAPLSFEDAARVIVQVARGLAVAHERGIVHRDIKPENIYLCDDEDGFLCKVLDFGVGRHLAPGERKLTAPGVLIGTPEYMSPEMILGRRETDPYADLWSLAVVAYHALARELPFDGDTAREIVLRVVTKPHRPLSDVRDDVTSELDAWFERALSKDVTKRFASARELASAFVAAVDTRRPSLRFSHPDLTLAEDGTLPGFQVDQAPTLQRPRPALSSDRGSDRGTIRIHEKFTPNGTAVIPRERDPESGPHTSAPVSSSVSPPDSLPPPVSSPRIRLSLLLAGVSVVSALLTLLCIRLFSDPVASAATSQLVPGALPQTQAAPIQSERASTPPSASPSASASASRPPADKKTLGAPALSTDYGF